MEGGIYLGIKSCIFNSCKRVLLANRVFPESCIVKIKCSCANLGEESLFFIEIKGFIAGCLLNGLASTNHLQSGVLPIIVGTYFQGLI